MEKLLIATRNPGKFKELKVIMGDVPYEIVSLEDLGVLGDVEEDGETYEENAFKKARFFSEGASGILTLSDDSGLEVDALKGELGLKTRRWGKGESASDEGVMTPRAGVAIVSFLTTVRTFWHFFT